MQPAMKYKIYYGLCLLASCVVTYISIHTAKDAMNGKPPVLWVHVLEFFAAVFLVALGLYFKYKSLKDK